MKRKALIVTAILTLSLCSSMNVFAQPKMMADGTVFDSTYYAQNNPDIIAVLGSGENTLFQHYVTYGKAEGRLAYDPATNLAALSLNKNTTAKKTTNNSKINILKPEPEGNYVPTTYKGDDGYTYLDLGCCILTFGPRNIYSDKFLKNKIDSTDREITGSAYRQCIETGAIEVIYYEGTAWISGEGARIGY